VFFYLLCLVPTIWLLELNDLELRIVENQRETTNHSTSAVHRRSIALQADIARPLYAYIETLPVIATCIHVPILTARLIAA